MGEFEARQEETGEAIPPEDYQREKRRVKARLATNNCYGVDLNPTAVELAKVSLWFATLHEDGKCPWFGLRLATGNSLVGARREVFKTTDVTRKGTKGDPNWLGLVPEPVPLHHSREEGDDAPSPDEVDWANWTAPQRPKGTIYHFLLPAEGMAAFDKDKVISYFEAMVPKKRPDNLAIIGGGAIGCEFAYVMNSFGVQVTLVEALDHVLPTEDFETCAVLDRALRQAGVDVRVKTRAGALQVDAVGRLLSKEG